LLTAVVIIATQADDGYAVTSVLLVVSGGPGTLTTVEEVLKKGRAVVVLANSGGVARDIYEYVNNGLMPTNNLDPDAKGWLGREKYCTEQAVASLPLIKGLGGRRQGVYNHPLLTFFGVRDLGSSELGAGQVQSGLSSYLVDALFSHCLNMRDAILQAVRWGDPQILRAKLADAEKLASNKRLPSVVARAFTLALSLVSSEVKPNARKKRHWRLVSDAPRRYLGRTSGMFRLQARVLARADRLWRRPRDGRPGRALLQSGGPREVPLHTPYTRSLEITLSRRSTTSTSPSSSRKQRRPRHTIR